MEPIAIGEIESGNISGYACGKCRMMTWRSQFGGGLLAIEESLRIATECCIPKMCEKHGKEVTKYYTNCDMCRNESRWAKEQAIFDKAEKVPYSEYTGEFLYRDGFGNEGYFSTSEVFDDDMEDDDGPITWAWGCIEETVTEQDCDLSDHVYEHILQDHHESAGEYVDEAKVAEASKLLFEACKGVKSYQQTESVVVTFEGWEP